MISQPKLGQLLTDIRKQKGWTQEELVDQCHVSVRTIQRIESGEVTPRHSTVKILFTALDYDMEEYLRMSQQEAKYDVKPSNIFQTMFAINLPQDQKASNFNIAWIAGIVFLCITFLEVASEFFIDDYRELPYELAYVGLKLATAFSFFMFQRGFISLAELFENNLLKLGSILFAVVVSFMALSDIILLFVFDRPDAMLEAQGVILFILYGCSGIVFGAGLLKLQDGMGNWAKIAGVLEIVIGASFCTVVLFFLGLIFIAPAIILEVLILIKAEELAKEGKI